MKSDNLVTKEKAEKNKIKLINALNNLKADYFLQILFNNLERKRTKIFSYIF